MSDLGDLGAFLREGSVSNLDWLEIDPEEYRALDRLPKQNLDVGPDLEALWSHEDKPASAYVDNKGATPHTMGDLSGEHGLLRAKPEDILKVARFTLMESTDTKRFQEELLRRFDLESLRDARHVLASALAERGLLGHLYVRAEDFPTCNTGASEPIEFVRRHAGLAPYVLAKTACGNCIHASQGVCGVFHKEIKVQVPYTEELAEAVERSQASRGYAIEASHESPRERIRFAFLAPVRTMGQAAPMPKPRDNVARLMRPVEHHAAYEKPVDLSGVRESAKVAVKTALGAGHITVLQAQEAFRIIASATEIEPIEHIRKKALGVEAPERPTYHGAGNQKVAGPVDQATVEQQVISASRLTQKRDQEARRVIAAEKAKPMVELLRREMLKGRGPTELVGILKQAFEGADFDAARPYLEPWVREAGLYGAIYTTQDSFDDCRTGADFLATHNPTIRGVVAGAKCEDCIYRKVGRCLMYGKPLVKEASELYSDEMVERVAQEYRAAGYDVSGLSGKAPANPRTKLAYLHREVKDQMAKSRMDLGPSRLAQQVHRMAARQTLPDVGYREAKNQEVIKMASRFMNEGLYGKDLLEALKRRFEAHELAGATEALRPVLAEHGLQGIHYIDPTVYEDYGSGCREASSLHRSRVVPYVKMGSKCASCVHQTRQGMCSVLNKQLVQEPPYLDKVAQQREVLASGRSTQVSYESLMNNGLTMMAEYQLQHGGFEVEVDPYQSAPVVAVQLGQAGQKV